MHVKHTLTEVPSLSLDSHSLGVALAYSVQNNKGNRNHYSTQMNNYAFYTGLPRSSLFYVHQLGLGVPYQLFLLHYNHRDVA